MFFATVCSSTGLASDLPFVVFAVMDYGCGTPRPILFLAFGTEAEGFAGFFEDDLEGLVSALHDYLFACLGSWYSGTMSLLPSWVVLLSYSSATTLSSTDEETAPPSVDRVVRCLC